MKTQKKSWKQRLNEYDGLPIDWNSKATSFCLGAIMGALLSALIALAIHSVNQPDRIDTSNEIEFCSEEMGSKC